MPIYDDIYDGPPRWYGRERTHKRYIAIHATANDASAEAEASYAKRRPDSTSSHYYVDDDSIVQSLDTDLRAFHAGSRRGNDPAISYELTARDISVGRAWWLEHIEWPLMVTAIARDCEHFNITPQDLTVDQVKTGRLTGIITHNEMRLAWGGTTHTDPGPNFPVGHLVDQVQAVMEDDMTTAREVALEVWRYRNNRITDRDAYSHLRVSDSERELLAGQAAILAAVAGSDVGAAVRDELARHRAELVAELGEDLAEAVAAELADLPAEQVEAAVGRALARTRLAVESSNEG